MRTASTRTHSGRSSSWPRSCSSLLPHSRVGRSKSAAPATPYVWANGGVNIPWNPDRGNLGPLTNAQAVQFVGLSFGQWDADSVRLDHVSPGAGAA